MIQNNTCKHPKTFIQSIMQYYAQEIYLQKPTLAFHTSIVNFDQSLHG